MGIARAIVSRSLVMRPRRRRATFGGAGWRCTAGAAGQREEKERPKTRPCGFPWSEAFANPLAAPPAVARYLRRGGGKAASSGAGCIERDASSRPVIAEGILTFQRSEL